MKALGFGTSRKTSPPPPSQSERVGRLSEAQLRQAGQSHHASPVSIVVEKRGRQWKRAGASLASTPATEAHERLVEVVERSPPRPRPTDAPGQHAAAAGERPRSAASFLPEIEASQPLDMDTNKYRLPDHTNGNGTKVQLETRREHLTRDMRTVTPDIPPPPPAKDSPPAPVPATPQADYGSDATSYFNPFGLQRPGSIYTLSRASFANQLAQLTSLQLPDAESLSGKVAAIPTAQAAAKALISAAEQIRSWLAKASEVVDGLDSDDDVEWAAAGGREGLGEVESSITRFEELINVYVGAVDELQRRKDIETVAAEDLTKAVQHMEFIMEECSKIRSTLQNVKTQVEIAMEWEELWNSVLGDIQAEMDELSRLVFEMEERRHKSLLAAIPGDSVDIGDLETIVEDTPPHVKPQPISNRFSLPAFPLSPGSPSGPTIAQDDSSLLALFARMQPLKASLDFLPMRLSSFDSRADKIFPTACEELEMRRAALDASYKKLEKDAESLRRELGEDRWVMVFRDAGRKALKIYESVERSVAKVKEALDAGMHLTNQPMMSKKIENFEQKKLHYGPSIERILLIIDKGIKDRLTVNGEILRLHAETQAKWDSLKEQMKEMDATLEEIQAERKSQQLRDSISSMLSNDRSTIASGNETPGSSPPSSVIMSGLGFDPKTPIAANVGRNRTRGNATNLPQPSAGSRAASMPTPISQLPKKPVVSRLSSLSGAASRPGTATPTGNKPARPASVIDTRPRWNSSTNTQDLGTGHNFKPLSLTTPSPYAKSSLPTLSRSTSATTPTSKLPLRSPLSRGSSSPIPEGTPTPSRTAASSRLGFQDKLKSPASAQQQTLPKPRLASQQSMSALNRRASMQPQPTANKEKSDDAAKPAPRPASVLGSSRRTSLLPQPKTTTAAAHTAGAAAGRVSPQAVAGARVAFRKSSSASEASKTNERPRWRV